MVTPFSFSSRITFRIASEETGSKPSVGSSRNKTLGLLTSARATISRCFIPFEKLATLSFLSVGSPTFLRIKMGSNLFTPKREAKKIRFSEADISS